MLLWLKAQIGDKPAWVIFTAAMIAAAGGALVAAAPGVVGWAWKAYQGGDTVGFIARDAATTKPLQGMRISILSLKTFQPVVIGADGGKEIVTQSNGLARAKIDLASADFAIEAHYNADGAQYLRTAPLLLKDGKLFALDFSKDTWALEGTSPKERAIDPASAAQTLSLTKDAPAWMAIARGELGQREVAGSEDNPRILEYFHSANMRNPDEVNWNSAFVNWVMQQAGFAGTNSGWGRNWLTWGKQSPLVPGCIAVFWRGDPSEKTSHVGFFLRETPDGIEILGGNLNNSVSIARLDRSRLLGCRMPA